MATLRISHTAAMKALTPLILSFTVLATMSSLVGCGITQQITSGGKKLKGIGPVKTESRSVDSFEQVQVSGHFQVALKVGSATSLAIETQENLLKEIETTVENGVLKVKSDFNLESDKPILVTITSPALSALQGSGASSINLEGLTGKSFTADLSGASKLRASGKAEEIKLQGSGAAEFVWDDLQTQSLAVDLSGGCSALVSGSSTTLALSLTGGSSFKGETLLSKTATVDTSGGCNVVVNAKETLIISASGGGNVRYIGNPVVTKDVSGGVNISQIP